MKHDLRFMNNKGQAMLLSVMIIGGVLVTAGTLGGLLTLYQIRQANDVVASTQAVFAADAGIEWQSFCTNKGANGGAGCSTTINEFFGVPFHFSNNASSVSSFSSDALGTEITIRAQGFSRDAVRALETVFTQ